ncbi:hypothetical protein OG689_41590 [Kitasatospora sp. NBC_00240]|uniref:hypothetical protein n=1 Tax=Kitasatospora sp. NBC_00240 TaxID=2903567 RepID=UPI00225A7745|nr:hypothetical protein [Kitasatospora sp. NBC_00240]MCX5215651.1 hypothetical protein [Kitasatospora sp. NBC_00240]
MPDTELAEALEVLAGATLAATLDPLPNLSTLEDLRPPVSTALRTTLERAPSGTGGVVAAVATARTIASVRGFDANLAALMALSTGIRLDQAVRVPGYLAAKRAGPGVLQGLADYLTKANMPFDEVVRRLGTMLPAVSEENRRQTVRESILAVRRAAPVMQRIADLVRSEGAAAMSRHALSSGHPVLVARAAAATAVAEALHRYPGEGDRLVQEAIDCGALLLVAIAEGGMVIGAGGAVGDGSLIVAARGQLVELGRRPDTAPSRLRASAAAEWVCATGGEAAALLRRHGIH